MAPGGAGLVGGERESHEAPASCAHRRRRQTVRLALRVVSCSWVLIVLAKSHWSKASLVKREPPPLHVQCVPPPCLFIYGLVPMSGSLINTRGCSTFLITDVRDLCCTCSFSGGERIERPIYYTVERFCVGH